MRVVLITAIPFWHPGTAELMEVLHNKGVDAVAFDLLNGRYIGPDNRVRNLTPRFRLLFLERAYRRMCRGRWIKKYVREGDIVDIHFVEPYYAGYVQAIKRRRVKLAATLFGSDLYRTSPAQKQMQGRLFAECDAIVMSRNMEAYFDAHFPGLANRIRYNQYGSRRLEMVHRLNNSDTKARLRQKYGIPQDATVVTCGYNAKKEQQHTWMLRALDQLTPDLKKHLFLVFPVTYGNAGNYLQTLKQETEKLAIPFLWFEKRLDDEELAETKIISDITLNTQTSDALASSIKEAFVAGNILLAGDWLPYDIYTELGVYYEKAPENGFTPKLAGLLQNLSAAKERCSQNAEKILTFASWEYLADDWVNMYQQIKGG